MEFFAKTTQIDFMRIRTHAFIFSILIFIFSIAGMLTHGLELGLDFTGGTQIQLHTHDVAQLESIRGNLAKAKFKDANVQTYGSAHDVMIRLHPTNGDTKPNAIKLKLMKLFPKDQVTRVEFIGPSVGKQLMNNGVLAVLISMIATMIYIAIRFEYRFALSAALSLIHDPILILGIFAWTQMEFNLISLAALLTILGYSLNDTIVVYDRVRENFRKLRKSSPIEVMNLSINQTLSRTIMTSGLTLLVVIALLAFGGETLQGFSVALMIGIVIGTYSSIYVAGGLAVAMGMTRQSLLPKARPEIDNLP